MTLSSFYSSVQLAQLESPPRARVLDMSSSPSSPSSPPVDSLPTRASPGTCRPATAHNPSPNQAVQFPGSTLDAAHPVKEIPQEDSKPRPRRRTYVDPLHLPIRQGDDSIEPLISSPTGRPSSSWLRRISIISSSQNDSPLSGSRPDSPSLNGSTSPFFSSPFRADQPPNKLVKRPASQRGLANSHSQTTRSTGPFVAPTPLLRRPATSHQRLANMRQRSSTDSRVQLGLPYSPLYSPDQTQPETFDLANQIWRPYFRSEYPYATEARRRSSARQRARSPRRLLPEPDIVPTLLLSSSITHDTPNNTYRPDDNIPWMSDDKRPQTRDSINFDDTTLVGPLAQSTPIGERKPRQSFSVGDMITGTSPSLWKISAAKSLGRHRGFSFSKERSIEPNTMSDDLTAKLEGLNMNSVRLRKRRPATHTDSFRRRSSSSQTEFNPHQLDTINSENNSPKSRLRRRPQFSELRAELPSGPICCDLPLDSGSRSSSGEQSSNPSGNTFSSFSSRPKSQRLSAATSDPASTLVGSDNDTRIFSSGEEDETDFQSDTAFDSFPTRVGVGNPPAHRGPRIETIFDQPSPSELANEKLKVLENLTSKAAPNHLNAPRPGDIDENPSLSATEPKISLPTQECKLQPNSILPASTEFPNDGAIEWNSLDEIELMDDVDDGDQQLPSLEPGPSPQLQGSLVFRPRIDRPQSSITLDETSGREARISLFDWSEQQRNDKDVQSSEFRPKTVHGKHNPDTRGGRAVTRRGASAIHLRSQSVPISREPSLSNNAHQLSPKFGTWGLGNKGVSEDWDGDFEFEDSDKQDESKGNDAQVNQVPSNQGMRVPKAIMERQASVHGQFGHVQELTLLVEELKRLRTRAGALNIIDGPSSELWREARGIINLATLEDDEEEEDGETYFSQDSPPSPTFSVEDSDDDFFSNGLTKNRSGCTNNDTRRSPLSEKINPNPSITPPARPRTDSSLKAKFVLDTIHQQRGLYDPAYLKSSIDSHRKLPFDTQSLRDLVIRAGVVTRSLKEILRKAEGVCMCSESETNSQPQDPPFSQMFTRPLSGAESSCFVPDLNRSKNTNGYRGITAAGTTPNENDGCERMTMMTVV
ncbi:hypothetical protein AJ78_06421 [Emergomyces pasteurianus Ep9510]|uniref:Uncharacterized protein n=1 Tax=Emergomyces pasteurianus Ep9510 TaxID=1447872 RepID=A0A1J9PYW9_9EURO|nr:hypothetical protein AJ78_06421 [Emergomyces pasteurianus Ep9510]